MKILKDRLNFIDIRAHSLRGKNFYEGIIKYREKILPLLKDRILSPEEFHCTLCNNNKGKLFLEWEKGYQLFQCNACEAVSPNISLVDISKYLDKVYNTDTYYKKFSQEILKNYEYRKKVFGEERYRYILERLDFPLKTAKILDIGCGAGYFLSVLKDKDIIYKGLEVSPQLVRYCVEQGLNVHSTDLAEEPDDTYDAIVMFDVLEHLSEPIPLLYTVKEKLKKGGFCVAFTPNIHSVGYELMLAKQNTLLPFEHFCFFNQKSFKYLEEQSGLKIHSVETYGLDIMDYLLMKEYENNVPYTEHLYDMMILVQAYLDKIGVSNHFRITLRKE